MLFTKDIAGKEVLTLNAIIEVLGFVEEKENLFVIFPIDATIQDGGKRKEAMCWGAMLPRQISIIIFFHYIILKLDQLDHN